MRGHYGYMFAHLKKHFLLWKKFNQLAKHLHATMKEFFPSMIGDRVNEITKKTVSLYAAKGLLLDKQKIQANVAAMIAEAVQKERKNLRAEITVQVNNAIANSIPPQIFQYGGNRRLILRDPLLSLLRLIEPLLLILDHDDHQDDAHPMRESSAKKQKTTALGTYTIGHEHNFITEIIARRADGKIDPITEPDYKYLNKNDIEDLYLLCVNGKERVHDFQLGMKNYQQKVNLTALTIKFPGIEEYELFNIISKPVIGMIYDNIKKEKRVMIHREIHKFCDATLKRVLGKLKKYNKDIKYGYVDPSPDDADVEYL
ncbi:hypothetical protein Tco_1094797 [Tanacetum coccineum]|uniref:Topoisomerase VI n=1 Tax=Tanacetum coccineum TaxID=301880 RepID=A0ABQ5IGJ0_9ASTR